MAPIKFEENIKEKLEQRRIPPSAQAWEQISSQLSSKTPPKKKAFGWYAIAASIVGLLVITLVLLNTGNESAIEGKPIVNTPSNEKVEAIEKQKKPLLKEFNQEGSLEQGTASNTNSDKKSPTEDVKITSKNSMEGALANQEAVQPNLEQETKTNVAMDLLIQQQVNLVVAQVDSLERQNTAVTDAEIELLLRNAQEEILTQKIFKSSNKVDAMALLDQAETELDLSVRDQLFEALKTGYLKVRTAVADRNK